MHLVYYHFYKPQKHLYSKPTKSLQVFESGYHFSFNGKEKDDETYGEGNAYDFGARIYDSRLGRWLSLDPLQDKYPYLSPYNFVGNSPNLFIDPDGQKIVYIGDPKFRKEMKAHLRTIMRSVDPETRAKLKELKRDKTKILRINDVSNSGHAGFHMSNNSKISNIGIASKEELEKLIVPGATPIKYDNGVETYEKVQNNTLYTLTNEMSHALDWYKGTQTGDKALIDDFTKEDNTRLTWDEIKSNKLENMVRNAKGDDLRLEKSHIGWEYSSPEVAKKACELSKEKNTVKREAGQEKLE
jgi:RHS repeat-associated protein